MRVAGEDATVVVAAMTAVTAIVDVSRPGSARAAARAAKPPAAAIAAGHEAAMITCSAGPAVDCAASGRAASSTRVTVGNGGAGLAASTAISLQDQRTGGAALSDVGPATWTALAQCQRVYRLTTYASVTHPDVVSLRSDRGDDCDCCRGVATTTAAAAAISTVRLCVPASAAAATTAPSFDLYWDRLSDRSNKGALRAA